MDTNMQLKVPLEKIDQSIRQLKDLENLLVDLEKRHSDTFYIPNLPEGFFDKEVLEMAENISLLTKKTKDICTAKSDQLIRDQKPEEYGELVKLERERKELERILAHLSTLTGAIYDIEKDIGYLTERLKDNKANVAGLEKELKSIGEIKDKHKEEFKEMSIALLKTN